MSFPLSSCPVGNLDPRSELGRTWEYLHKMEVNPVEVEGLSKDRQTMILRDGLTASCSRGLRNLSFLFALVCGGGAAANELIADKPDRALTFFLGGGAAVSLGFTRNFSRREQELQNRIRADLEVCRSSPAQQRAAEDFIIT